MTFPEERSPFNSQGIWSIEAPNEMAPLAVLPPGVLNSDSQTSVTMVSGDTPDREEFVASEQGGYR